MNITEDQIERLGLLADELDNLHGATQLGMTAAFHLKQIQRALPELSTKIKALIVEISGDDPWAD